MLLPDVTEILDDPEVGGGQAFTVYRKTVTITRTGDSVSTETFKATGNIQQETGTSLNQAPDEDKFEDTITIRSRFIFQNPSGNGNILTQSDEVLYDGNMYRVTSVENWSKWGFTIARATRMREG